MAKINFKQPKYILPLALFPFLLLGFFVYTSFKARAGSNTKLTMADSIALVNAKGINVDMPGVSKEVTNAAVKDKFAAYQERFKNEKDISALNNLSEPSSMVDKSSIESSSAYTAKDIAMISNNKRMDSLRRVMEERRSAIQERMNNLSGGNRTSSKGSAKSENSDQVLEQLRKQALLSQTPDASDNSLQKYGGATRQQRNNPSSSGQYEQQMKFFREQMRVVDSLKKAEASEKSQTGIEKTEDSKRRFDPSRDTSIKALPVTTGQGDISRGVARTGFNTIRKFKVEETVKAVIDESKTITAGARVRIKLLQQIYVGDVAFPEGTFIYGIVTGFQIQRINISITSINFEGKPMPVKLDVFDTDGYLGLYIPNSNFREFTKEIGNQSTQGLSNMQSTSGSTDLTSGLVNKLFSSTTTTAGKLIAQNKAAIKSDYIIYLKENKTSQKQ